MKLTVHVLVRHSFQVKMYTVLVQIYVKVQKYHSLAIIHFFILAGGKLIVCLGYNSCGNSVIRNVKTIIALGVESLSSATITNANEIYLLGYNAGTSLIINNSGINYNTTIYCQNNCDINQLNIITGSNPLYCDNAIYPFDNFTKICTFFSHSPTSAPTLSTTVIPTFNPTFEPTLSSLNFDLQSLLSILQGSTTIIGITLIIIVVPVIL